MLKGYRFAPVLLILVAGHANAQAPTVPDCVSLASVIAAGQITALSERAVKAMHYYASCEAKNSHAEGTLDVAYKAFSLGGTYGEAKQSQMCTKTRDELGFDGRDFYQAKQVFDSALPTVDRCLALLKENWSTKAQGGQDWMALTISNSRTGGGAKLLRAEADPGITCNPPLPTQEMVIDTKSIFSTTCRRTPTIVTIDGVQHKSTEDAALIFILDDGPFIIPMKGYQSSVVVRLQQRIDDGIAALRNLLPNSKDFYVLPIAQKRQEASASCGADILISAACTNDGGAQAAVGPVISANPDGTHTVKCLSYNPAGRNVEGNLICLKKRY